MELKHFGTAGIRGIWGQTLTQELVEKVASSILQFNPKKVALGYDTRQSRDTIRLAIYKILSAQGVQILDMGIVPMTVLAYMTKQNQCDIGIMITASHNPPEHNGIKVFDANGEQFDGKDLEKLDAGVDTAVKTMGQTDPAVPWKNFVLDKFRDVFAEKILPNVAIDFANGAGTKIALDILDKLGFKNIAAYNIESDGSNVNRNCGATHPNYLCTTVQLDDECQIGFAFDGDADRCVVCDGNGVQVSPDKLLAALGLHMGCKHIVGTIQSNTGVSKYIESKGVKFHRADVGERHVVAQLKNLITDDLTAGIGGEASSHFIFPSIVYAGESLITMLMTLKMIVEQGKTIAEIVADIPEWASTLQNIAQEPADCINPKFLNKGTLPFEKSFPDARIMIRKSGTEKLTRVFVEAETEDRVKELAEQIVKS